MSPAAQGASLTEGKKAKRGNKKQEGQSGSPKQGSDGSENELDATNVRRYVALQNWKRGCYLIFF